MMIDTNKKTKFIFLCLCALAGVIFLSPYLNFQPALSQGDHGHSLYSFDRTYHGELPYRDYWSCYGPLMPFYYGFLFRLLGVDIQTVLFGQLLLNFLAGIGLYLALSVFYSPWIAFVAAVWFWAFNPDFFYTFNHLSSFPILMLLVYSLFSYVKSNKKHYLFFGGICVLLLCLIKLNIGVAALMGFGLCLFSINYIKQKKICFAQIWPIALILLIIPVILSIVYSFLLSALPSYARHECLPFFNTFYYNFSFLNSLGAFFHFLINDAVSSWPNLFYYCLIILTGIQTFHFLSKDAVEEELKNNILLTILIVVLLWLFIAHEYFLSGIGYKIGWFFPFQTLLSFILLNVGTRNLSKNLKFFLFFLILLIPLQAIMNQHHQINGLKNPTQFLGLKRAEIFIGNPPDWISTVRQTVFYMKNHLKEDETFLAIPDEAIYYFLMDRKSPTWHVILIEASHIPEIQEKEFIANLENKKVNYVLLSNRSASLEPGLGIMGKTYLPSFYRYIMENFEAVETIGNWDAPAGWVTNHSIRIFKRKSKE